MNGLGKASLFLWPSDLFQTGIQVFDKLFLVKVLADEDNLLHAVAIVLVPVSQQAGSRFISSTISSSGWVAYQSPASEICFCRPACSNRNDMLRLWAK